MHLSMEPSTAPKQQVAAFTARAFHLQASVLHRCKTLRCSRTGLLLHQLLLEPMHWTTEMHGQQGFTQQLIHFWSGARSFHPSTVTVAGKILFCSCRPLLDFACGGTVRLGVASSTEVLVRYGNSSVMLPSGWAPERLAIVEMLRQGKKATCQEGRVGHSFCILCWIFLLSFWPSQSHLRDRWVVDARRLPQEESWCSGCWTPQKSVME